MRTAALPNFRKLYRIIDSATEAAFKDGLPADEYIMQIDYRKWKSRRTFNYITNLARHNDASCHSTTQHAKNVLEHKC